VDDMLGIV
ncbi:hypothetical protein D031_4466B, partial [Vibrio parahaemolyticus VP-48]